MEIILTIATFWILLSFLIAYAAEKNKANFHNALFVSILFTPIVGLIRLFFTGEPATK